MVGKEPKFRELLISKWKITNVPEHSMARGASTTYCTHHLCPSPVLYLRHLSSQKTQLWRQLFQEAFDSLEDECLCASACLSQSLPLSSHFMRLFMCVCYVDCDLHEGSDGDLLIVWPQHPAQCGARVNTPQCLESKSIHKELLRVFRDKE